VLPRLVKPCSPARAAMATKLIRRTISLDLAPIQETSATLRAPLRLISEEDPNMSKRISTCSLFTVALLAFVAGCGVSTPEVASASAAISTDQIVDRADRWVDDGHMLYCQVPNHQYDSACGYVCNRTNNPFWNPYRSDCSGFVSWAWGLPPPGRITTEFAPFDNSVSHTVDGRDLWPGDALNSATHMFLFKYWITPGRRARFMEEGDCHQVAHEFDSDVSINGTSVYVSWEGATFTSIRFNQLTPAATAATATTAADPTDVVDSDVGGVSERL